MLVRNVTSNLDHRSLVEAVRGSKEHLENLQQLLLAAVSANREALRRLQAALRHALKEKPRRRGGAVRCAKIGTGEGHVI